MQECFRCEREVNLSTPIVKAHSIQLGEAATIATFVVDELGASLFRPGKDGWRASGERLTSESGAAHRASLVA